MSRSRAGEPVFRLHLAYPQLRVEREGEPAGVIPVDAPDRDARLAALGERVIAEGGRLVAVLPEAEVWRARIAGRPSASRLRAAAAAALGTERIVVVQGPPDPEGRPIAALRRTALIETRAFLASAGLRPDAFTGTGSFPGFKAPPEFDPRGPRMPLPSAPMAAGLVTAAALLLAVAIQPDPIRPAPPIEIAVAPAPEPVAAEPIAVAEVAIPAPPRARPADFAALVPRTPTPTPTPTREATVQPAPTVAFAARNLPPEVQAAVSGALREQAQPRVAVLLEDGSVPAPRRRPAGTAPGTQQAALPTMTDAAPKAPSLGPRPRPATVPAASSAAAPAASTAPVAAASAANAPTVRGPRPRPAARASTDALLAAAIGAAVADAQTSVPEPVRVAALGPGPDATFTAAPVVAPPEPRRATAPLRAAPVQPQQVVRPVAAAPVVRAAPVQPTPVRAVAAPVAKPPATTRTAAAPVRTASVQPAATPPRTARQETARPGSVTLIGVFGRTDQRHALVRLGNGSTERVRAGDRVAGMQVAGIGSDSVRLAGGGRETVLRLPE